MFYDFFTFSIGGWGFENLFAPTGKSISVSVRVVRAVRAVRACGRGEAKLRGSASAAMIPRKSGAAGAKCAGAARRVARPVCAGARPVPVLCVELFNRAFLPGAVLCVELFNRAFCIMREKIRRAARGCRIMRGIIFNRAFCIMREKNRRAARGCRIMRGTIVNRAFL